jgi:N-acetylglutamate synthase-like GNAT family acetyltransferase
LNTPGVASDEPNLALSYLYAEEMNQGVQEYRITVRHQDQNIGRLLVYVYGEACQLIVLEVDIGWRRQRVGHALMQELITFMRKLNVTHIWVRDYAPEMGDFLMALGFSKRGRFLELCIGPTLN